MIIVFGGVEWLVIDSCMVLVFCLVKWFFSRDMGCYVLLLCLECVEVIEIFFGIGLLFFSL